jgi:hypothetical protein
MIESVEEFLHCAQSKKMEDYHRVTMDTATEEVWIQIIEQCPEYHYWIASNKYLPESMMWKLSESKDVEIRWRIAQRYDIPEALMVKFSKDKSTRVKFYVGDNMACPIYILERLSKDKRPLVRDGVAQNMRAPKRLLRVLAKDSDEYVREHALRRLEVIQRRGIPKVPKHWETVVQYEWIPDPNPDE